MNYLKRGDVVVANLEPVIGSEQQGRSRPCVIVSPRILNDKFKGVIVCPITDAKHLKQSELGLTFVPAGEAGLQKNSLIIAFQIRMIDKRRILKQLGTVNENSMSELSRALRRVVGVD